MEEEGNGEKIDVKTGNKAKGNSNRTPSQIEAFERARDKKREIAKIKKDNTDAIRIEKEIDLQAKKLQTIEIQKRINMYKSEDEEAEEEEVVIVPKKKVLPKVSLPIPVAKPKKKKIIYQEEESEESEEEDDDDKLQISDQEVELGNLDIHIIGQPGVKLEPDLLLDDIEILS